MYVAGVVAQDTHESLLHNYYSGQDHLLASNCEGLWAWTEMLEGVPDVVLTSVCAVAMHTEATLAWGICLASMCCLL